MAGCVKPQLGAAPPHGPYLEVQGTLAPFKEVKVLLRGLSGSFWVDIRQVKEWYKHRGLEVQGTFHWVITLRISQL